MSNSTVRILLTRKQVAILRCLGNNENLPMWEGELVASCLLFPGEVESNCRALCDLGFGKN